MYKSTFSARSATSFAGNRRRNLSSCVRTEDEPSRMSGRSLGKIMATGRGSGEVVGNELI